MHKIKILEGTYKIRGEDVDLNGMVFPLVEEFKFGANGGYVTVDGAAVAGFPDRNIKIKCDSAESYQKVNSNTKITAREESDDEDVAWYEDEEFWLGDANSGGYEWDQHNAATRATIVLAAKSSQALSKAKVALHYCWLPFVIYLGMQHPINGKTVTLRDVLGV